LKKNLPGVQKLLGKASYLTEGKKKKNGPEFNQIRGGKGKKIILCSGKEKKDSKPIKQTAIGNHHLPPGRKKGEREVPS